VWSAGGTVHNPYLPDTVNLSSRPDYTRILSFVSLTVRSPMAFVSWVRWLRSLARPRGKTYRRRNLGDRRPRLEVLEDRLAPAVLPTALVSNPTNIGTGFSPNVVQDPINSLKLFEVHTTPTALAVDFS